MTKKLVQLSAGGGEERSTSTSAGSYSCDTPVSGDEADTGRPVQFSTSPPVDVHKPRRSLSPPGPGVFGFPHSNGQHGPLSPAPSPAPAPQALESLLLAKLLFLKGEIITATIQTV